MAGYGLDKYAAAYGGLRWLRLYSSDFLRVGFTECLATSKSNIAVTMMLYKYKVGDVDAPVS